MTLPVVLVVDDQFARDPSERMLFLRRSGLSESGQTSTLERAPIALVVFCSGQRNISDTRLVNDFAAVAEVVERHDPAAWSAVLLDMRFDSGVLGPDGEPQGNLGDDDFGERLRGRLAARYPDLPVVILTSKTHTELEQRDVRYLAKDGLDPRGMATCLLTCARLTSDQRRQLLQIGAGVLAQSDPGLAPFLRAWTVAPSRVPVLIAGETGVGKEVLARYIHRISGRTGPFVRLSSKSLSVDAGFALGVGTAKALLDEAEGGTFFLDDISSADLTQQRVMLQLVEDCDPHPADGTERAQRDVRLLCSSSEDLAVRVRDGRFGADLYRRLAGEMIRIPSLRERQADIPLFVQAVIEEAGRVHDRPVGSLDGAAAGRLQRYDFGGNIRELRNLAERLASATGPHQLITLADVEALLPQGGPEGSLPARRGANAAQGEAPEAPISQAYSQAANAHGRALTSLVERALRETRRPVGRRNNELGDLNPTLAMKLLLERSDLTTGQAADEIKRLAVLAGPLPADSDFARVLQWAAALRGSRARAPATSRRVPRVSDR